MGNAYFTGTVPLPGNYPGGILLCSETDGNFEWQLTGSAFASGKGLFVGLSGSQPPVGTRMTISRGGSISFISDGYYWLVLSQTGSVKMAGTVIG